MPEVTLWYKIRIVKRTIAIVGVAEALAADLIPALSGANFDLLLVPGQEDGPDLNPEQRQGLEREQRLEPNPKQRPERKQEEQRLRPEQERGTPTPATEAGSGIDPALRSSVRRVDCTREGCWEADIVMLGASPALEATVLKLKDVTTQKIVLLISGNNGMASHYPAVRKLEQWLPHSKIISVLHDSGTPGLSICGEDSSAVEDISTIFRAVGMDPVITAIPCNDPTTSSLYS